MAITADNKKRIQSVLNIIESGNPDGNYADVTIYADGEKGDDGKPTRQITYGTHQTTEQGHLKTLLQLYAKKGGNLATDMAPYTARMGNEPLWQETEFIAMLKDAGANDPIMKEAQDEFFDTIYYKRAYEWFEAFGFTLPLSLLVIYDSFIHSNQIRDDIRKMFAASPPSKGGNEKEWVKQYVDARHEWLGSRQNPILRKTVYRTEGFKLQIALGNWDLSEKVKMNGMLSRSAEGLFGAVVAEETVAPAPKPKRPRTKKG